MAVVTISDGVVGDMHLINFGDMLTGEVTIATETDIIVSYDSETPGDAGYEYTHFRGNNFTFSEDAVTGGTVTEVEEWDIYTQHYAPLVTITGLNLSAVTVYNYIRSGDVWGALAYAFAGADVMYGANLNDRLYGFGGDDEIFGRAGDDQLYGDAGNDRLEAGSGNDVVYGGVGNDQLYGQSGDDQLFGGDGLDIFDGAAFSTSDGVGDDLIDGGAGSDRVRYDAARQAITVNLAEGWATDGYGYTDTLISIERIDASAYGDILIGGSGSEYFNGKGGDDTFIASGGDDDLEGLGGVDTVDFSGQGAGVTVSLGAFSDGHTRGSATGATIGTDQLYNIENAVGTSHADDIAGSQEANLLRGGGGDDVLTGGAGDDILRGEDGGDTAVFSGPRSAYVISYNGGVFTVSGPDGTDKLEGVEFVQFSDQRVQIAGGVIQGTPEDDTLTGADWPDVINGLGGDDTIRGLGGDDVLNGGSGDDTLDGGGGGDVMTGGTGNDTYTVASSGDQTIEAPGGGTDTVRSWINWTLADNVENLVLIGEAKNGFGNDGANQLTGNAFNNYLAGRAGDDAMSGGGGEDTLVGEEGNDRLAGNGGDDLNLGGLGDDLYIVSSTGDRVIEEADEGHDTVQSWVNWTLWAHIEDLELIGQARNGWGNTRDNTLTGNGLGNYLNGLVGDDVIYGLDGNDKLMGREGTDTLHGGAGDDYLEGGADVDTMIGGIGDDIYVMSGADVIVELEGEGIDTIRTWSDRTLADNVENLELLGAARHGRGNELDNVITGNTATNEINGYGGNDTLIGAGGNDIFIFTGSFGEDVITDFTAGPGSGDRIRLETSWMADFADVLVHATDSAEGVVIAKSGLSITLTGVTKAQLNANDFHFVAASAPEATKGAGPLVLPDLRDGEVDDQFDPLDPLVLPAEVGPKENQDAPLVCDADAAVPTGPFAFVNDTETLLAGRDPHRLMLQPTANDWVM